MLLGLESGLARPADRSCARCQAHSRGCLSVPARAARVSARARRWSARMLASRLLSVASRSVSARLLRACQRGAAAALGRAAWNRALFLLRTARSTCIIHSVRAAAQMLALEAALAGLDRQVMEQLMTRQAGDAGAAQPALDEKARPAHATRSRRAWALRVVPSGRPPSARGGAGRCAPRGLDRPWSARRVSRAARAAVRRLCAHAS